MGVFRIDATDLHWIYGSPDDAEDLCLHGHAVARIGQRELTYDDTTVSATALYLLKSLTEDHIIHTDNQMLPCCGYCLYPDPEDSLDNVVILGCPNGVDWTVRHDGDMVILELEDGARETVSLEDYRSEVFRFADQIEAFYQSCKPRILPEGALDRRGYIVFWNEWHRRRNQQEHP